MDDTAPNRPAERLLRSCALLAGVSGLLVAPTAMGAPVAIHAVQAHTRAAGALSASVCSKVSAGSVSAIVGYTVPAATASTREIKAIPANGGVSAVVTTCTFGPQSSLAALLKDVTLETEVTSKPLTAAEVKQDLAKAATGSLKITVSSYSGLGVPALYFTESGSGITGAGISGIAGTTIFGASVEQTLPMSKLAALAKLAKKL